MSKKDFKRTIALALVLVLVGTLIGLEPFKVKADEEANAIIVTTEKALMKEIAKKSAATIILETSKSTTITMKSKVAKTIKRAKNKIVIIDAPNAKVRNYLNFKTLTIKNAKAVSERVNGNKITVQSATTKFSVYKNITVKKLTIPAYTQVTLGKKAKITTVKYTRTKPAKVTATPTEKPVVTTVPTTIPAPTETPTPVVVPTQTPVVTEVPTQAPTVTEAPTTKPSTTETPKPTDTIFETPAEQVVPVYYDANGKMYYAYYDYDSQEFRAEYEAENFVISESDIVYPAGWQWPIPITPTVTESQSASPEVTATVTVQPTKVETTPEPTQEVEVTTTPEPTQEVKITTTPEPTQEVEPTTTVTPEPIVEVHKCTNELNSHNWVTKNYKVSIHHIAQTKTVHYNVCTTGDCHQSFEGWTLDQINAHLDMHTDAGEFATYNNGGSRVEIVKEAYYSEDILPLTICADCGKDQNALLAELDGVDPSYVPEVLGYTIICEAN